MSSHTVSVALKTRPTTHASCSVTSDEGLALVEDLMRDACLAAGDPLAHIACEHLDTGGKRLRARLALATAACVGGDGARRAAAPWAAAVELIHNASLIHDDVQDGDVLRREAPTTWAKHGVAQAINVGDLMLVLPFGTLDNLDCALRTRAQLTSKMSRAIVAMTSGQAQEPGLLAACRNGNGRAAYVACAYGKTGALFALPVFGSLLLSGVPSETAAEVSRVFGELGVLFQMQDDVLDVFGDKGRKLPASDLYEGKVSALVVADLEHQTNADTGLLELLAAARSDTSSDDVARTVERFATGGALTSVLAEITARAERAVSHPSLRGAHTGAALRELASELVSMILAPIAPLFGADAQTRHRIAARELIQLAGHER